MRQDRLQRPVSSKDPCAGWRPAAARLSISLTRDP
jgi:hypothetical protein